MRKHSGIRKALAYDTASDAGGRHYPMRGDLAHEDTKDPPRRRRKPRYHYYKAGRDYPASV